MHTKITAAIKSLAIVVPLAPLVSLGVLSVTPAAAQSVAPLAALDGGPWIGGGILIGNGDAPGGIVHTGTTVANNIIYDNPGAAIKQYCYAGVACIGSGNSTVDKLVYRNGSGISLKKGAAGGTIDADPQFVDYRPGGAGDYRLRSSSPALDQGSGATAPTMDIDGRARPLGRGIDLGAYESH